MSAIDAFRYDDKQVLVVGGATGMGAAAVDVLVELGADVAVMDHAPVERSDVQSLRVDLRDRADIDSALHAISHVDSIFSAAGVADGTPGVARINFIGHRHIVDTLAGDGRLPPGGAVCMISSGAGIGWEANIESLKDFIATKDFDEAVAWIDAHPGTDDYMFSKQAVNFYVAWRSFPLLAAGIRINAILPGPTDTPLARANADLWLTFAQGYRDATKTPVLTARQMAETMAFLNSDAASGVSGVTLPVDVGHLASSISGSYGADRDIIQFMLGRA